MSDALRPSRSKAAMVFRVASGNFLEFYDFFLYGFYARHIAATFFPVGSEFASLMLALVVFGAGFLVRPIGAVVLGAYIDKVGRRKGLIVSLGFLATGTVLVAFMPSYASIGPVAPALVVAGRLLQGLSAGGEPGGVAVYLSEIASPGKRGFYVAWQSGSQQVATVAAGLTGFAVNTLMAPSDIAAWGWRIPFFIGCLVVPFIFMIRRSLQETEVFTAQRHHPSLTQSIATLAGNWRTVGLGMMMVVTTTVSFYTITTYTPTFGVRELHLSTANSLMVTCCIGLSNLFWLPIWGAISDRVGRKPILVAFTVLMILTAYPSLSWLVARPSLGRMFLVELWLSFVYAGYNGAMTVALTEIVPAAVRVSGFSLAYSLATTLGGFSLAISTGLIEMTGDKAAPGLWMSAGAVCGLIAALGLYGRRGDAVYVGTAPGPRLGKPVGS
ncbi:MFS transporter [Acidisphaera sp. S103]|uniref:MFS transporter n=1 Tax=Acidisphaera sp. S103 TaxID=1747223 RepID=UPI00131A6F8D|nr:MFS transporter [Acidisphaera sp. S103]